MRKLIHLAVRLYPARWRERYGAEFDALLEDMSPGFRDLLNIVKGALLMQLKLSNVPFTATAFALAGMLAAGLVSIAAPKRYVSTSVIFVRTDRPDQLRQTLLHAAQQAFDNQLLARIIEQNGLYPDEPASQLLTTTMRRFKANIVVRPISPETVEAFEMSFTYPDSQKAQKAESDLVTKFVHASVDVTEHNAAVGGIRINQQFHLIDPPHTAPVRPKTMKLLSRGLVAGALTGVAIALLRRRFRPAPPRI
jgi:uncharacterized protein involved in exopolysaccharide biosynthesis